MRKTALLLSALILLLMACSGGGKKSSPDYVSMNGEQVYKMYCVACHGADGTLGFSGASNLKTSAMEMEERIKMITHGKGVMNAFKGILTKEEIDNVAVYIETLRTE
jgi:cytochrome c6